MSLPCTQLDLNADISGIGVRVSFYIQTVALALQCLRTKNLDEAENALITLTLTNMAYLSATMALGFGAKPSLTLYDALVVVYLNLLSCPVIVFLRRKIDEKSQENQQAGQAQRGGQQASKSIPTLLKENRGVIIRGFVILQTYLFLSCSLAIFAIAHTFGKAHQCNDLFVVTLFHPFPVLPTSRRVLLGLFGAATIAYSGRYVVLIGKAVRRRRAKKFGGGQDPGDADSFRTSKGKMEEFFDKWFVATVVGLIVLSALHVTNTELLKLYNERRTSKVDNSWSFGQILPLFLAAYSVWLAVSNFWDLRCNNKKAVSDTGAEEVNEFPGEEIRLGDNNHSDNYRNYN